MNYINILQDKTKEDATKDIFSVLSARALDALDEAKDAITEVSKATLGSYIKKASVDAKFSGYKAGYNDADATSHAKGGMYAKLAAGTKAATYDDDKAHKRLKSVSRAVDKLTAKAVDDPTHLRIGKTVYTSHTDRPKQGVIVDSDDDNIDHYIVKMSNGDHDAVHQDHIHPTKAAAARVLESVDSSSKIILEYSAKGTVDGKPFNIACNDGYDEKSVAAQNPHLKPHHVKAIVDHTESDAFMDDQEAHTHQNGLEVHSTSDGYQGDFDETKDQIKKMTGK